jgi:hypothetical protein
MRGYGAATALRAFPVRYANDVDSVAASSVALGVEEHPEGNIVTLATAS